MVWVGWQAFQRMRRMHPELRLLSIVPTLVGLYVPDRPSATVRFARLWRVDR